MAKRRFDATWMGQYRGSNKTYYGQGSPIRTADSVWWHSYVGFDYRGILNAINTSSTPAKVYLKTYVTKAGNFAMGLHKEKSNKKSNGLPFYRYALIYHDPLHTGWKTEDLTNVSLSGESTKGFKNALNAGYTGIVWYGDKGAARGEAIGTRPDNGIFIEVEGTWNTPPTKPKMIQPRKGTVVDKKYRIRWEPATDKEQKQSELKYHVNFYDGEKWNDLGITGYGVTELLYDFSTKAETTRAQIRVRAGDDTTWGAWDHSAFYEIRHNRPPTAPTNLSPIGGEIINHENSVVFSWTHNHADSQTKFDFRWKPQDSEKWNEITKNTTTQSLNVSGNTFPIGVIEWQVRTYEQEGLVSPWSAKGIINSSEPTDAPEITEPKSGDTLPTSSVIVSWSTLDQESYEIQLIQNDQVVWQDAKKSDTRLIEIPYELENDSEYSIRIRVMDAGGIFSSWDRINFHTSFTPPHPPEFELEEFDNGIVYINITNEKSGEEGEPSVEYNEIYRRVAGTNENFVRIATELPEDGSFMDYMVASDVLYEYYVKTIGDNRTTSNSESQEFRISLDRIFLGLTSDPADFISLEYNPSRSIKYEVEGKMMQFKGRKFPIMEYGEGNNRSVDLSYRIADREVLDNLIDLLTKKETLLYRDSRGRKEFVMIQNVAVTDVFPKYYDVSFTPLAVDYQEGV